MLEINQKAPEFTLPSTSGTSFMLSEIKRPLIIYFYPKDFTRGCTKEACDFRDNFSVLKNMEIDVVGVSTDSLEKHKAFKEKYNLPFELLSDKHANVSKLYKARMPLLNMSKRVTYLVDENQLIKAAYSDLFGAQKHLKNMIKTLSK